MLRGIEFLLVKDRGDKSLSDYRRAVLAGYAVLLALCTSIYYIIINLFKNYNPASYFYYWFIGILCVAFFLNHTGRHAAAKCILLAATNLVVFAFSSREPPIPSAFLFYIICSLMALVLFDVEQKHISAVFIVLSTLLYLIARFTTFSLVPPKPINSDYLVQAYNNNFLIVYFFSVLAVYFLVRINHSVEESLQHREKQIIDKNQTLTKTNAELDRFIYSTSHDLRAPLSSIEGLLNIAEHANTSAEVTQYHMMMRDRIRKLEYVLSEISQYSRNTKLEIAWQQVNLREYINRAIYDVEYIRPEEHIRIQIDIDNSVMIETDPMRLSIILNNLISNAFKYSDHTKEDPYVIIRGTVAGKRSTIIIEDNGEGIDKAHQPKIFEMFYRGTSRSTGSGLGLYLVKEAVEKLGGSIAMSSVRGEGTKFTVTI